MIDTNCTGLVTVTHAGCPGMVERNRGHVFNMGSVAGSLSVCRAATCTARKKAFVRQFSLNLRADLAGTALRVTDIEPGLCGGTEFRTCVSRATTRKRPRLQGHAAAHARGYRRRDHWIATRPAHVNINAIEMMPVAQTFAPLQIHRG